MSDGIYYPGQVVKQEPLRIPLPTPLKEHDAADLDGLGITGGIFLYVVCRHCREHAKDGAITHRLSCKYARFRKVPRPPIKH